MTDLNPELAAALKCFEEHPDLHKRNTFAQDVVAKFYRYGSLSAAQQSALISSLARDHEATELKGLAPEGRQTVTGTVLNVKQKEGFHGGLVWKMLVKLENKSKVWVTRPNDGISSGDTITFTATFERSKDDPSFAFGKRPELVTPGTEGTVFNPPKVAAAAKVAKRQAEPKSEEPKTDKPSILAQLLAEL